jgi:hypothetical protein
MGSVCIASRWRVLPARPRYWARIFTQPVPSGCRLPSSTSAVCSRVRFSVSHCFRKTRGPGHCHGCWAAIHPPWRSSELPYSAGA